MNEKEKNDILLKTKEFVRNKIITAHHANIRKLDDMSEFNVNPFLFRYLTASWFGKATPENLAKTLIYPRVFGTSINTTFGNKMQEFCNSVLDGYASVADGIDIEFIDALDDRKKYCQVKAGPQTINKDDIKTITDHFANLIRRGRTNNQVIPNADCVVGVIYGDKKSLSANYRKIDESYPVYAGQEFWLHLTGDEDFYGDLIQAFSAATNDAGTLEVVEATVKKLASKIDSSVTGVG